MSFFALYLPANKGKLHLAQKVTSSTSYDIKRLVSHQVTSGYKSRLAHTFEVIKECDRVRSKIWHTTGTAVAQTVSNACRITKWGVYENLSAQWFKITNHPLPKSRGFLRNNSKLYHEIPLSRGHRPSKHQIATDLVHFQLHPTIPDMYQDTDPLLSPNDHRKPDGLHGPNT